MQIAAVSDSNTSQGGNGMSSGSQASDSSFQQAMAGMLALLAPAPVPPLQATDGSGAGKAPLSGASGSSSVAQQMISGTFAGGVTLNQALNDQQGAMPSEESNLPNLLATLALQQNPEQVALNVPSSGVAVATTSGQPVQPGSQSTGVPSPGNSMATVASLADLSSRQTVQQSFQPGNQVAQASESGSSAATAMPSGDTTSTLPIPPGSQSVGIPDPESNTAIAIPSSDTTSTQLFKADKQSVGVPNPGNSMATVSSSVDLTSGQPIQLPNQPTSPSAESAQVIPLVSAVAVQAGTGTAQVAVSGNIRSGNQSQSAPNSTKKTSPTQQNPSNSQEKAGPGFSVALKTNLPVTSAPSVQPENKDASGNGANDGTTTGGGKVTDNAFQTIAAQTGVVTQTTPLGENQKSVTLPDLSNRLLQEIKQFSRTSQGEGQTQVQFKLEPEHLGELTIKLFFNRGELSAHFYAGNSSVKEILEGSLQQLKDNLGQQDLKLNEAFVFVGGGNTGDTGSFYKGNNGNGAVARGWLNRFGNGDTITQPLEAPVKETVSGGVNYLI